MMYRINSRVFAPLALLLFALVATGSRSTNAQQKVHSARPVGLPPLRWVFEPHPDKQLTPHTGVFLMIGTRRVMIERAAEANFQLTKPDEYHDQRIPRSALTACVGWWAGGGENLYVVCQGRRLVVYRCDVDEQEAGPQPYRRLLSIPL